MKLDAPGQVEAPLPGSGDVNCELDARHGLRRRSNGSTTPAPLATAEYHGAARLRNPVAHTLCVAGRVIESAKIQPYFANARPEPRTDVPVVHLAAGDR